MRLSTRPVLAAAFLALVAGGFAVIPRAADAANVTEGFEVAPPTGWKVVNQSATIGSTTWSQGITAGEGSFPAQAGATNSWAHVDYKSTTGTNTIDNWLITPAQTTLSNGDTWSFWTRDGNDTNPDRLQLRLSTNGATCSPGGVTDGVGDFMTLLVDVNPTLTATGYPTVWTQYTGTLGGLPAGGATGCLGLRYYVTAGGPTSNKSFSIGVDTFSFTESGATATPSSTPTVTVPPPSTATATTTTTTTATATATATATTTATTTAATTTTTTITPTPIATSTATATTTTTPTAPAPVTVTVTATPSASSTSTCPAALSALSTAQSTAAATQAKALKLKAKAKVSVAPAQKKKAVAKAKKAKTAAAAAQSALAGAKAVVGTSCR